MIFNMKGILFKTGITLQLLPYHFINKVTQPKGTLDANSEGPDKHNKPFR